MQEPRLLLAALVSLALHAVVSVTATRAALPRTTHETKAELRDSWSTDSVEVGTEPERASGSAASERSASDVSESNSPEPVDTSTREPAVQKPVRRVRRAPTEAPRIASATPAASNSTNQTAPSLGSSDSSASAAGTLGSLGLPPGTRHLGTAFTRALPEATHRDAEWTTLPLGAIGSASIEFRVSEDGHLEELRLDPSRPAPPEIIARMLDRVALMLKTGTFSLDTRKVEVGSQRFELDVTLSQRSPNPDELADPRHLYAEGKEPPSEERPGRAYFTLNSGRHIEILVRLRKR